jgi:hypothetical protein
MKYIEQRLMEPSSYAGIALMSQALVGPKYGDALANVITALFAMVAIALKEKGNVNDD